jgi:hypothetical protein
VYFRSARTASFALELHIFERATFANQQLVDFGAPARSGRVDAEEVQQTRSILTCYT